ncbi:MAG TPA: hypothetical protein VNO54_06695 [Streptosporangiaceae bacterium]|nr:hypothetical protein [Streptosporangiaceae bacterium]
MGDETDPPETDLTDRVERLETSQTQILGKLDQLISGGQRKAAEHEETKLGRPTAVADQVTMELERRDQEAAEKASKEEFKTVKETVAKLTEVKPVQPQPRRQRFMWGSQ